MEKAVLLVIAAVIPTAAVVTAIAHLAFVKAITTATVLVTVAFT